MVVWGLIVAAGRGERLGREEPKAFVPLAGVPLLTYSVRAFSAAPSIAGIVVVLPAGAELPDACAGSAIRTVTGGDTRQASVRAGLAALPDDAEVVVVHDAARPLLDPTWIEEAVAALSAADAAVVAIPSTDTVKRVEKGAVVGTLARDRVWRAQTPQAFRLALLRFLHEQAEEEGRRVTDDAALFETAGARVALVVGDERNLKITTATDLIVAEALLRMGADPGSGST